MSLRVNSGLPRARAACTTSSWVGVSATIAILSALRIAHNQACPERPSRDIVGSVDPTQGEDATPTRFASRGRSRRRLALLVLCVIPCVIVAVGSALGAGGLKYVTKQRSVSNAEPGRTNATAQCPTTTPHPTG